VRWTLPAALIVLMSLTPAAGAVEFGGQLVYGDDQDLGLGARIEFDTPDLQERTRVQADFNWYFPDDGPFDDRDFWEIDLNLLFEVGPASGTDDVGYYLGGGLNFAYASWEFVGGGDDSEKDLGVNLLGGVELPIGMLTTIGELRVTIAGSEQYTLGIGVKF
jgi:hypothetical protein